MSKKSIYIVVLAMVVSLVASSAMAELIAYYPFSEGQGTTTVDATGNGNDGTFNGNVEWIAGYKNKAVRFDTAGERIVIGPIDPTAGTNAMTLAAWVKWEGSGSSIAHQGIVGKRLGWSTTGDTIKWFWETTPTGDLIFRADYNGGGTSFGWGNAALAPHANEWTHVAVTWAAGAASQYINGQPVSSGNVTFRESANATPVTIGCIDSTNTETFVGIIDEVQIHNAALTAEGLQQAMTAEFSVASSSSPFPPDTETDVQRDVILSWSLGEYAVTHDVYFGTDANAVAAADAANPMGVLVSQGQTETSYDPEGLLAFGQTYYWRVDEINAPDKPGFYKGNPWSFTAETYGYLITTAIKATASSQSNTLTGPEKTIDGSGLNAEDQHSTSSSQMWLSKKNVSPIWIQYEFASPYKLYQMWVWNQNQLTELDNGLGAMEVMIETSTDGTTWTALAGVPEFAQAPGEDTYVHNTTVDFGGVLAKFVKLTIISNWGGLKQAGLSEVRFFYVPVKAYGPTPASGTAGVAVNGILNWRPGRLAASHEVYLGTDPNALSKAGTVTDHRFNLSATGVEYDRTYYWKVNEVNAADVWEGDVWSFSTPGLVVVDDFESYDDKCKRIFYTWADGYGASAPECGGASVPGNGSGSTVGNPSAPYAEQTIIHGGRQSLPMAYDNASASSYSEATRTFAAGQDWVQGGIKTLVLYFCGAADNAAGQLYVKINNNKVVYNGKADVLTSSLWRQWNVDLASVGGNLRSVTSLTIGVSGTGKGILYVDDLRLYRAAPAVVQPVDPGTTGLSAYYMMDGDMKDSSGKGYNGTLVEDPVFVDSQAGFGKALQFDGTNDHVELPIGSLISSLNSATIATWVNFTTASTGSWVRIFDFGTGVTSGNPLIYMYLTPRQGTTGAMRFAITTGSSAGEQFVNAPGSLPVGWHHVAVAIDGTAKTLRLYLDGEAVASGATTVLPKDLGVTNQNWLGRSQWSADGYYQGLIDEFRIYNRALSEGEVRYLAGDR